MAEYDVESYWSRVGREIAARQGSSLVAGDDNPFFRYKRKKFLKKFLHTINFDSKIVLEVGCGPGGNLLEIGQHRSPEKLLGVDISQTMIEIATGNLARHNVAAELYKVDGANLPFADRSIDLSYTVTVLQHNTDGTALKALVRQICRVTRGTIVLMEDTGSKGLSGTGSFIGRQVDVYTSVLSEHGFEMSECTYLHTRVSYLGWAVVSEIFLSKNHKEGEPIGTVPRTLTASLIPVTRILDDCFVEKRGLTKMVFNRRA
jgi:SAM-dependent methyltransferase